MKRSHYQKTKMTRLLFGLIGLCLTLQVSLAGSSEPLRSATGFIENKGQVLDQNMTPNPEVKYLLSLPNLNIQLKANSFSYDTWVMDKTLVEQEGLKLPGDPDEYLVKVRFHRVDIRFLGANPNPEIVAESPSSDVLNYYNTGTGESGVLGVHHYGKVTYKNLYPGIDLEFVASPGSTKPVEYNFILHPGADASQIQWIYKGPKGVSMNDGNLLIGTLFGELSEAIPYSYLRESRREVKVTYRQVNDQVWGIQVNGNVPEGQTLVIDPVPDVQWASYYGSSADDFLFTATRDANGNIFASGSSTSTANIATSGVWQGSYGGGGGYGSGGDVILVKFDNTGTRLWATYYGGSGNEQGQAIGIDDAGNLYISGTTSSSNVIATSGAFQTTRSGTYNDAFLAKFTNAGILCWGTFYGGTGNDRGGQNGLVVDDDANVYFGGTNNTANNSHIASTGAYQQTNLSTSAYDEPFVAKFDSSGGRIWGTYYGGNTHDRFGGIAVDANKNVYIVGYCSSTSSVASSGSHQSSYAGGSYDGFIAKLDPTATTRLWGTYFGGSGTDAALAVTVADNGDIFVCGYTQSSSGIATSGAMQTNYSGDNDIFVTRFTGAGTQVWGTYFGGSGNDVGRGISAGLNNSFYLCGDVMTTTGMTTSGAYQTSFGGVRDALIAKFEGTGQLKWSSYMGGNDEEVSWSVFSDAKGLIFTGRTKSTTGLATNGAYQTSYGGGTYDGFITVIDDLQGTNNAGINKFTSPDAYVCAGSYDLEVEVMNAGVNPIDSVTVEWTVDGVPQTAVKLVATLSPGSSQALSLGNVSFTQNTPKSVMAWTTLPNNGNDTMNSNDTVEMEWMPGLSGTYTLGGSSPDYATFADAAEDLNKFGVCGPVTFLVAAGTYNERIELGEIAGVSATNTITFAGAGKTTTVISTSGTGTSDMASIVLEGADHVTFRDMSVENDGSGYAAGIWLSDGADSNRFIQMTILLDTTSNSNNVNGIVASGSMTGIADGSTGSWNLFDSIEIHGGYFGIRLNGPNTTNEYALNNRIRNVLSRNSFHTGIYLRSQSNVQVINSRVDEPRGTAGSGIMLEYTANYELGANVVYSKNVGIYLNYTNRYLYNGSIQSRIYNCMVSSTDVYALYVNQSYYGKVWHNSFVSNPTHSVVRYLSSQNMDLRNNHIQNFSTTPGRYVLFADNLSTFTDLDFNNYYTAGGFINLSNMNYANLPVLQAAITQFNQGSASRDPQFVSATDLHTSINVPGTYVGIDEDIDGDFRNTVAPVVGADEVNVPNNAGVTKMLSPTPVFCAGSQDVKVRIGNYGVNVIDSVRVNWSVDGTFQGTLYLGQSIGIRGFMDTTLGSVTFVAGDQKNIRVWTSFPNGVRDSLRNNDTLAVSIKTGLSGTYTIGGVNPDYPDFSEAIGDLGLLGICSPVVFEVRPGTYNERITLREVTGASAANTITFKGAGVSSTSVSYSGSNNSDWATIMIDGGDHYIFRDMTVASMGANYGVAILLTNQADSNRFINLKVQSSPTSTSLDLANIAVIATPNDLYGATGTPGSGNLFDSLEVTGGYYGMYFGGSGQYNSIRHSTFRDQYVGSIFANGEEYFTVAYNQMSPVRNTGFSYGIFLQMNSNVRIHNNTLNASGEYGMYLQMLNFLGADPAFPSMIYNNMVSNTSGYAFYAEASEGFSVYHNSFRSIGNSAVIEAAVSVTLSYGVDMRNNTIRNDNPNSLAMLADGGTFDSLDYNNYYSFGDFVRVGSLYNSLLDLKNGLPQFNQNSYSQDPQFLALTNLHTSVFLPGSYVGVNVDIDGESRCPQQVSIGADDENWGFAKPVINTTHTDFYSRYPIRFEQNIGTLPQMDLEWYVDGNYYTDSASFEYIFNTTGQHTVKLRATRCIHQDSVEFQVNILSGKPTITIIGNNPDSFRVFTSYVDSLASALDVFGTDITGSITSGSSINPNQLGTYYIWYKAEDAWGNTDSVVRRVSVIDDVVPQLTLNGNDTIHIDVFDFINDPGSAGTDNYYSSVTITIDSSQVLKNIVGIYTMTYTATDGSGNMTQEIRWVIVEDNELPVLDLVGQDTVIVRVHYPYVEPGAKVTDNYCPSPIAWSVDSYPNTSVLGDYLLTYSATDCQGNEALEITRLVRVVDNESPVIYLNGLPVVTLQRWTPFNDAGVSMSDNYYTESQLMDSLKIDSDVDPNWIGSYSVCYRVTDPSGNRSNQVCRVVNVVENTTSVKDGVLGNTRVYPNPTSGKVTIELGAQAPEEVQVTVFDANGKAVYRSRMAQGMQNHVIDLNDLSAGIYSVQLSTSSGVRNVKLQITE